MSWCVRVCARVLATATVVVFFKATGNAPQLKQSKFKLASTARFQNVTDFLRKQLQYQANESLVCVCANVA